MRWSALFLCLAAAGCKPDPASTSRPRPSFDPAKSVVLERRYFGFDCSSWQRPQEKPIRLEPGFLMMCAPMTEKQTNELERLKAEHGPHFEASIVVRVNPVGSVLFMAEKSPLPVGTAVLKEKHMDHAAHSDPIAVAMMIKREKGYDPENGDWEYAYQTLTGINTGRIERGRIKSCIDCHKRAKGRDYLFRNYL